MKKTFGRFQLEAPTAYQCKQILGLRQTFVMVNMDVLMLQLINNVNQIWGTFWQWQFLMYF
jgi:hypothetical protein